MWHSNNFLTRTRISVILLLLISVRLIPIDLLHYHQSQLDGSEMVSGNIGILTVEKAISSEIPTCSFDKFLSLTSTGFVLDNGNGIVVSTRNVISTTTILELSSKQLLREILNKGSPLLA